MVVAGYPLVTILENGDERNAKDKMYKDSGQVERKVLMKKTDNEHVTICYKLDTSEG